MDDLQISTLQRWIAGQGNNAAANLVRILESLKYDPEAVVLVIQDEQLAAEADELKQGLLALAARGFNLATAAQAVAQMADEAKQMEEQTNG